MILFSKVFLFKRQSQDSLVGIVTGYVVDGCVSIHGRGK
jgi:hypothetical protein